MTTKLVVTAPTFYSDKEDIRYQLAIDTCREAAKHGIRMILVDASPDESVRQEMTKAGTTKEGTQFVRVCPQTSDGRKGAALREGVKLALEEGAGIVGFQEPEKVKMVEHWRNIADHLLEDDLDICCPRRLDGAFKASYPIEQYHSEHFANMHLDALAKKVNFPSIDWTMGPFATRAKFAKIWLEYDGELWDAQLVPIVLAQRWYRARVTTYEFEYAQAGKMKLEEEGDPQWTEKRLHQLNNLFEFVGEALKNTRPPDQIHELV